MDTLHGDLSTFYCSWRHSVSIKRYFLVKLYQAVRLGTRRCYKHCANLAQCYGIRALLLCTALATAPWRTVIKRLRRWWRRRSFPAIGFHQDLLIYTNSHPVVTTLQRNFLSWHILKEFNDTSYVLVLSNSSVLSLSHHRAVYICNLGPLTPTFKYRPNWLQVCNKKAEFRQNCMLWVSCKLR